MCLNQVDHVFKPGRSCVSTIPAFWPKQGGPGENAIKRGKMKVDHVFKPGLLLGLA